MTAKVKLAWLVVFVPWRQLFLSNIPCSDSFYPFYIGVFFTRGFMVDIS